MRMNAGRWKFSEHPAGFSRKGLSSLTAVSTLIYNIAYTTDNKFIIYTEGESNNENINENDDEDRDGDKNHNENDDEDRDGDENHNENDGSYSVLRSYQLKNGSIRPPSQ